MLSPAVENLVTSRSCRDRAEDGAAVTFHLLSARPDDALELARAAGW